MKTAIVLPLVVALLSIALARPARAGEDEELFAKAAAALAAGDYGAAIDGLEALADRGFVHPDASFDRGLAYALRVRQKSDKPGDLGRAAAGFEEALLLRPGDPDAEHALDLVRAEVTRRRSRRAKDTVDVRPTIDRAIVALASERTWAVAAIVASVLLAAGLVMRRRPAGPVHVAGSVLAPSALVALAVLAPLWWHKRTLGVTTKAGVVVATEVTLADEPEGPARGESVPEAARVEVGERRGGVIHVRHGAATGWVPIGTVRILAL